jgi:hypothetical protein
MQYYNALVKMKKCIVFHVGMCVHMGCITGAVPFHCNNIELSRELLIYRALCSVITKPASAIIKTSSCFCCFTLGAAAACFIISSFTSLVIMTINWNSPSRALIKIDCVQHMYTLYLAGRLAECKMCATGNARGS